MKTFSLVVPVGNGNTFEANLRGRLDDNHELATIIKSSLESWRPSSRCRAYQAVIHDACQSEASQLLMSMPGVGVVTASTFATAVKYSANFRSSRSVGAWLGLNTRRYQSGQVDYNGHISRRGDHQVRGLPYARLA